MFSIKNGRFVDSMNTATQLYNVCTNSLRRKIAFSGLDRLLHVVYRIVKRQVPAIGIGWKAMDSGISIPVGWRQGSLVRLQLIMGTTFLNRSTETQSGKKVKGSRSG